MFFFFSFFTSVELKRKKNQNPICFIKPKKKIVPDPVSKVKVIARSDSATITWEIPARAEFYRVYLVIQGMLLPINDGAGLNITTNDATINSVSFIFPLF